MTLEVCDESLGANSFGGGGTGVKEDRKLRPEVSLMPKPPPYNRPRFHRFVRARISRKIAGHGTACAWPGRGIAVPIGADRMRSQAGWGYGRCEGMHGTRRWTIEDNQQSRVEHDQGLFVESSW
jgi:hypothetical protein